MSRKLVLCMVVATVVAVRSELIGMDTSSADASLMVANMLTDESPAGAQQDASVPEIPEMVDVQPLAKLSRMEEVFLAVGVYLFITYNSVRDRLVALKKSLHFSFNRSSGT